MSRDLFFASGSSLASSCSGLECLQFPKMSAEVEIAGGTAEEMANYFRIWFPVATCKLAQNFLRRTSFSTGIREISRKVPLQKLAYYFLGRRTSLGWSAPFARRRQTRTTSSLKLASWLDNTLNPFNRPAKSQFSGVAGGSDVCCDLLPGEVVHPTEDDIPRGFITVR